MHLADGDASPLNQKCIKFIDSPGKGLHCIWFEAVSLFDTNSFLVCRSVRLQNEGEGQHLHPKPLE